MKMGWRGALGLVLGAGLLVWALRGVGLGEVAEELRHSNLLLFAATTVAGTLIFPLRARRWRTILDPIAFHLPFAPLWRATAIGAMVTNVIPVRAGEVARAYALSRETPRVGFSAAFASIAVDRVFDSLVVLLLMIVALLDPAFPRAMRIGGEPVVRWMLLGVGVLAAVMGVLYLIVFFPRQTITLYEAFSRRVAPRFERAGREALASFASGLGVLRHPGRFAAVFAWTLAHWLMNGFAFWLGFRAVGIHAPFGAALLVQGVIAIGIALPSAPGFFGVFEYLGREGLRLYGVSAAQATSWAIGFHILTFIPITLIGIYYFARLGLHFRELSQASTRSDAGGDGAGSAPPNGGATESESAGTGAPPTTAHGAAHGERGSPPAPRAAGAAGAASRRGGESAG